MGPAASFFTFLLSIASAAMLVYWIACVFILLRKDGENKLHRD